MAHHDLKLSAEFWDASVEGIKPFEVRFDDRKYAAGDTVRLHEVRDDDANCYTGRVGPMLFVSFVLRSNRCRGLLPGWVVLGLCEVPE